jgi:hypothetical protein
MHHSFSAAKAYLQHPDARIREVALYVMAQSVDNKVEFIEICKDMVVSDADAGVRISAMGYLGDHFAQSNDNVIGKLLATVICSQSHGNEDRKWAYMNLLCVFGRGEEFEPIAVDSSLFPSSVDWRFVEGLL